MFQLSQSFIPMGICIFLLIIFIIYRICVLKNGKPFFPIIAVLMLLACVPYSSQNDTKVIEASSIGLGDIPIAVTNNGYYTAYEKNANGLIITHKSPVEKTSLVVDDSQPSTLYHHYLEKRTDRISLLFTYVGYHQPISQSMESYSLSIHSSQLPPSFVIPKPQEPLPPQNTAPAEQTVMPGTGE